MKRLFIARGMAGVIPGLVLAVAFCGLVRAAGESGASPGVTPASDYGTPLPAPSPNDSPTPTNSIWFEATPTPAPPATPSPTPDDGERVLPASSTPARTPPGTASQAEADPGESQENPPGHRDEEAAPQKPPTVWKTSFKGNTAISGETLNEALYHKGPKYFWNKWPFFRRKLPRLKEPELSKDILRVRKRFEAEGYYDTNVSLVTHLRKDGKRIKLHFTIRENEPVTVRNLRMLIVAPDLNATALESWKDRFREAAPLKEGGVFRLADFEDSQREITHAAGQRAYALAGVEAHSSILRREAVADVQFVVTLGPRCAFGEVSVSGNDEVRPDEILRESTIAAGQPYEADGLDDTQRRIYELGYFRSVTVDSGRTGRLRAPADADPNVSLSADVNASVPPGGEATIDVDIAVKERKFRKLRYSIGYGTEDHFRTSVSWERQHVFHGARTFKAAARYSSLEIGADVDFLQRFWPSRHTSVGVTLLGEKATLDAYDLLRYGTRFRFIYDNKKRIPRTLGLSFTREVFTAIRNFDGFNPQTLPVQEIGEWFNHVSFYGSARMDRTDDPMDPQRGYRVLAYAQVAHSAYFSDVSYWKATLEGNYFVPLARRLVVGFRTKIGAGQALEGQDSITPSQRFYTGGSNTVRGYAYQYAGPQANGYPIGGPSLLEGNVELRYPIYKAIIGGVVFVDAGQVWLDEFAYESGELLYGTGIGLRIYTPIGPIRLDYGYKINPARYDDSSKWRIHFSISHTF